MNLHHITRNVSGMVPDARNVEARRDGSVYVLRCELGGRIKSVQFTSAGLYGSKAGGMYASWPKSEVTPNVRANREPTHDKA